MTTCSMPERHVISNTSPLLYLHQAGQLNLLAQLYKTVIIPPSVARELLVGESKGIDVPDTSRLSWIQIQPLADATLLPAIIDLGPGEAEVIALGLTYRNSLLILDDQLGRRIARLNKLTCTGTLGVLIKAKHEGYLSAVTPVLEALQKTNMWLDQTLIQAVLAEANEL
jgi:uncharacterized protein